MIYYIIIYGHFHILTFTVSSVINFVHLIRILVRKVDRNIVETPIIDPPKIFI